MPTAVNSKEGVFRPSFFLGSILTAFSGRQFDRPRYSDFLNHLGIPEDSLICVKQEHTARVLPVTMSQHRKKPKIADGMVTQTPGLVLGIFTADCIPAFFWDDDNQAAGLVHAGWRGLKEGILKNTVVLMRKEFGSDPAKLKVAFGPAIRVCCYEVGDEFENYFPREFVRKPSGKGTVDLIQAAATQLEKSGISKTNLADSKICTSCQNDKFFSARREKDKAGRILSVLQIPKT